MLQRLAVLVLVVAATACAGGAGRTPGTNRNLITRPEISASRGNTAYEVVQQLRPDFLRGRVSGSISGANDLPVVYLDGTRLGDLEQLRSIPAAIILTIQLISASDATTRWGTGYPGGVIEVKTRT
jgi:hypothetical protein